MNTTTKEEKRIKNAQTRLYRRALGLAPPYIAHKKGLEVMYNKELDILTKRKPWTDRIKEARIRLLNDCRKAGLDSPLGKVIFEKEETSKIWKGRVMQGCHNKRGNWLARALKDEKETQAMTETQVQSTHRNSSIGEMGRERGRGRNE